MAALRIRSALCYHNAMEVTLQQMLSARDARVAEQRQLAAKYGLPVVCLTMNIAGPVKRTPLSVMGFLTGAERIRASLKGRIKAERLSTWPATGCTGFFLVEGKADEVKGRTVEIEEADGLGRLLDIDVTTCEGEKLSRAVPRRCLVCGGPAFECARSRAHGLQKVLDITREILLHAWTQRMGALARGALLAEAEATPKPGLVDLSGAGAHTDMDIDSFRASANALHPYFTMMSETAAGLSAASAGEILSALRPVGVEAQKAMERATGGVNTHKGAIYSMGILCAALTISALNGAHWREWALALGKEGMKCRAAITVSGPRSNGERLYAQYGVAGIIGEAAAGFPHLNYGLERLRIYEGKGFNANDRAVLTLLDLMAVMEDTNAIHRGGFEGLQFMREGCARLLTLGEEERLSRMWELDAELTARNISPGGCADMLALSLFVKPCLPCFEEGTI